MNLNEDAASGLCCQLDALSPVDRAPHARRVKELFGAALLGRTERSDGYDFDFGTEYLEELARFVALERLCCPFLRFALEVQGEGVRLRITGPPGGKKVIEAELLS